MKLEVGGQRCGYFESDICISSLTGYIIVCIRADTIQIPKNEYPKLLYKWVDADKNTAPEIIKNKGRVVEI